MGDLARELRDEYPAVDVTTVWFSRDFAGVGCCVIPQDRVLAVISALEGCRDALEGWIAFAEEELGEFDIEECDFNDTETLCHKCESSGCINLKIRNARAALAKLTPEQTK